MDINNTPKYISSTLNFSKWIIDNANEIANACKWASIKYIHKPYVIKRGSKMVVEVRIAHSDDTTTCIFCQVANSGLPFAAIMESQILFQSVACGTMSGNFHVVIASPNIDKKLIDATKAEQYPISFLKLSPDKCIYWKSDVQVVCENLNFTNVTIID